MFGDSQTYGVRPGLHTPVFASDGLSMVVRTALRDGVEGLFMHIMLVSFSASVLNKKQMPLTLGTFTVNKILAWDPAKQLVWVSMGTGWPKKQQLEPLPTVLIIHHPCLLYDSKLYDTLKQNRWLKLRFSVLNYSLQASLSFTKISLLWEADLQSYLF